MDSKDKSGISRRKFIVGVSTGVVGASCTSKKHKEAFSPTEDAMKSPVSSAKSRLRELCLIIGPWPAADRDVAEDLLDRFLSEKELKRFAKHEDAIATLPSHLPRPGSSRLDKIPLDTLSKAEKDALMAVLFSLYTAGEVIFYLAGESNAGNCMGDLSFIAEVPT